MALQAMERKSKAANARSHAFIHTVNLAVISSSKRFESLNLCGVRLFCQFNVCRCSECPLDAPVPGPVNQGATRTCWLHRACTLHRQAAAVHTARGKVVGHDHRPAPGQSQVIRSFTALIGMSAERYRHGGIGSHDIGESFQIANASIG